jgi:hypothetical protein
VVAKHASSEEGGIDWGRLASDRNVSHTVARALWERACATAPGNPMQAEHAFHVMLEEAEAANATHEPGRETLVDATPGAREASSLGPGKWTRVLLEEQKPGGPAGPAKRGTENAAHAPAEQGAENAKQPSAEALRSQLIAAGQAGKQAAALLAASDPATIVEALRELRASASPGLLPKIMGMAGGAIERILTARGTPDPAAANRTPPASTPPASTAPASTAAASTAVPVTANRAPAARAAGPATAGVDNPRSSRSSKP